jgi:polyhydroxyalkanoate synthesis repressor PhaR
MPAVPRVIRKYANRRLYDTSESRYVTLRDLSELVLLHTEFVVIDFRTHTDITVPILLDVLSEQLVHPCEVQPQAIPAAAPARRSLLDDPIAKGHQ